MRKAFGRIGELLKRFGGRLTPSGSALRVPEAGRASQNRLGGASKRLRRRQPLPPPSSSLCRYRTQALPLLNRARVFFLRGGGMVPSAVTSGCPKRSEGGFPVGTRRNTIPPQTKKTKRLNTKALIPKNQGFICARYWDRTSDLFRVREARYRCANRAHKTVVLLRGEDGIRTRVHGFAGRCLTTRPPHRIHLSRDEFEL